MNQRKFAVWIQRLFSERDAYNDWLDAPNHGVSIKWHPYPKEEPDYYECFVLNSETPSDQVWIGNGGKWYHFYGGKEFRRAAAWVLWRWVWHDWCGLKTKLYMWGVRLYLASYPQRGGEE